MSVVGTTSMNREVRLSIDVSDGYVPAHELSERVKSWTLDAIKYQLDADGVVDDDFVYDMAAETADSHVVYDYNNLLLVAEMPSLVDEWVVVDQPYGNTYQSAGETFWGIARDAVYQHVYDLVVEHAHDWARENEHDDVFYT